ncbi:MAG: hypothetical protein EOO73_12200 [Myxococcales bacterium]|nr:MAG: hypothetical protein EOO73_12200 [Myxococcales bacterium]
MSRTPWPRLALVAGLLLAPACSQLIGIEDAQVDGTLGASGSSVAGTSAVSGSSTAAASGASGAGGPAHDHGGASEPAPASEAGSAGEPTGPSGAGGAPPEPSLCERYCDEVTSNCKGKYEQYRTFDQCIQVCKRLPAGTLGDDEVNTVACRVKQAEFAEAEPFVYCKSAGPLGAGRCGSTCISYCSLMQATCSAESTAGNLELSYFESTQACVDACTAMPADDAGPVQYSSSASAEPSSFIGNNVYCRTYHVAAALEHDTADEHCPHAMGGDPCIDQ